MLIQALKVKDNVNVGEIQRPSQRRYSGMLLNSKLRKFKTMNHNVTESLDFKKFRLPIENVLEFLSHAWEILHIITMLSQRDAAELKLRIFKTMKQKILTF